MQKKRSRFKSKRQYKDEARRKQEAEALARQIQRRLDRLVPDKERTQEFLLWEVMNIFGPYCYQGNPRVPFEQNVIDFLEVKP